MEILATAEGGSSIILFLSARAETRSLQYILSKLPSRYYCPD